MPKVTAIVLEPDGAPVVRHEAAPGPAAERLRREATTLVLARGPGVVELVDSGDDEHGGSWLTTRYVGGGTLPDLARTAGQEVAVRALGEVADTLADLHERGIVHGRLAGDHVVGGARALLCGFAGAQVAAVDDTTDPTMDTTAFATLVSSTCSTDDGPARLARAAVAGLRTVPPSTDLRAAAEGLRAAIGVRTPVPDPPARGRVLPPRTPVPSERRGWSGRRGGGGAEGPTPVERAATLPRSGPSRTRPRAGTIPDGSAADGRTRPARRRSGRRAAQVAGGMVCALVAAFAVGSVAGRLQRGGGDSAATPPTTTTPTDDERSARISDPEVPSPRSRPPAPTTTIDGPAGPASPPVVTPSSIPPADPPAAGDPSSMGPAGEANVVSHGGAHYRIGDPGDLVVVGDWDCDGSPTPTVVRPSDGSVWTFAAWAPAGSPAVAVAVGVAPSPASAAVTTGPDGCDQLTVTATDGRAAAVTVTG